jgi:hypothetical protein
MRLPILALAVVAISACPLGRVVGTVDAGVEDGGTPIVTCSAATDCPQDTPVCSFGLCKRPCAANDGCSDLSTYCNIVTGFCEAGCRDSSTCAQGTVCSGGVCSTGAGCGSNCDCQPGQTCTANTCQDPPAQCSSPDDCPKGTETCAQYQCDGFSHTCHDPNPAPCTLDGDCTGRLGCAAGCSCVITPPATQGSCASHVDCTIDNETTTCQHGSFCVGASCLQAPACTGEAQCTADGLTCNVVSGLCERTQACAAATDCTVPPNTFCDSGAGRCTQPLCNNGGQTCQPGQDCTADGRCVTHGTGGPCSSNNDCQTNEYCELGTGTGACAIGCRDNSGCDVGAGQQCDGTHTCVGGGGGGLSGWQGPCTASSDCQAGLFCGIFSGVCQESCGTDGPSGGTTCQVGAECCPLSGAQCCAQEFVAVCSNTGC